MHSLLRPLPIRMVDQARIVVTHIARDLRPNPVGLYERSIFCGQLNFRHNEPLIGTREHIDLPCKAAVRLEEAPLLDQWLLAKSEHGLRIKKRDLVLELRTSCALVSRTVRSGTEER